MNEPFSFLTDKDFALMRVTGSQAILEKIAADASLQMAKALDSAIQNFINAVEGRDVPVHEIGLGGQIVKLRTHSHEEPNAFESFFLWRGRALGYRFITGSHTNDTTQAMMLDYTMQFMEVPRAEWPDALVKFVEAQNG